jgi:hypothetical protein
MSCVNEKAPRKSPAQSEMDVPVLWCSLVWFLVAGVAVAFALDCAPPWVGGVLLNMAFATWSAWEGGMFRRAEQKGDTESRKLKKLKFMLRILSVVLLAICLAAAVLGFIRHPGG